ncbi:MAG: hypothetical protein A2X49_08420 [Lentisphaerae bacterium GWF2_52_8]|nr:MAG: hypothetical protein A2X49_08420 [Lentisphaerae bacterium GWF2_52_8]
MLRNIGFKRIVSGYWNYALCMDRAQSILPMAKKMEVKMKKNFTLLELLIVIGVIMSLMAMLLPALHSVKETARGISCLSKHKQVAMAMFLYCNNNNQQRMPYEGAPNSYGSSAGWYELLFTEISSKGQPYGYWRNVGYSITNSGWKLFMCDSSPSKGSPFSGDWPAQRPCAASVYFGTNFGMAANGINNENFNINLKQIIQPSKRCAFGDSGDINGTFGVTCFYAIPTSYQVNRHYFPGEGMSNSGKIRLLNGVATGTYEMWPSFMNDYMRGRHAGRTPISYFDGHCEMLSGSVGGEFALTRTGPFTNLKK